MTFNNLQSGEVFRFVFHTPEPQRNYVRVIDGYYRRCHESFVFDSFQFTSIVVHDLEVESVPLLGYSPAVSDPLYQLVSN